MLTLHLMFFCRVAFAGVANASVANAGVDIAGVIIVADDDLAIARVAIAYVTATSIVAGVAFAGYDIEGVAIAGDDTVPIVDVSYIPAGNLSDLAYIPATRCFGSGWVSQTNVQCSALQHVLNEGTAIYFWVEIRLVLCKKYQPCCAV